MTIIKESIRYPVSTAVGVILLVLFGGISLFRIPVQLTPNVQRPTITVTTSWPGASPREVERDIIDEQEEQLKSLQGLLKMESSSSDSRGEITLHFPPGTDVDGALLRVSNSLQQVEEYPADALRPVITTVGADENAIAWFMIVPTTAANAFQGDISTLFDFIDDFVKPAFERVPGVAGSNIFGGRQREMQVIVDPAKLALRQVTLNELGSALERENRNYSGGDFQEGKRRYLVRTVGEYESPRQLEDIVIAVRSGVPIYLKDVARAQLGYRKASAKVFMLDQQGIAINAVRDPDSNLLEVMTRLKATVADLNQHLMAPRGLQLIQTYDESEYVIGAIDLVQQSLMIGGLLAIFILILFLRSASSTLIIAVAIPISIVGTFLMMNALGRSLNVISLAGLAFAVGMVVDNSIVVLENIYRHRQMGKSRFDAAYQGARQVWGAVLASTLTTVAVFVPVLFIQDEAGQLFGDIAVAISCAVALSLIIAITVIPSLSAKILGGQGKKRPPWRFGLVRLGHALAGGISGTVGWINRSALRRVAVVLVLTAASLGFSYRLMPKTEYLPIGNNNFLFGVVLPPPGYNVEETSKLLEYFEEGLAHLLKEPESQEELASLPGGGLSGFFYVALTDRVFMGARARDPLRVRELLPEFRKASARIPGTLVVMNQSSIFQRGFDEGRNIDIEFTGPDLKRLIEIGDQAFQKFMRLMPDAQGRPLPSLDLGNPEIQIVPDRRRMAELKISNRDLGFAVSALVDGAKASDYQFEGTEIDLMVMAEGSGGRRTHLLGQMPLATPDGRLVTLGSVARIRQLNGPVTINHRERPRSITLRITPQERMPLEEAMDLIRGEILQPLQDSGQLGGLYQASLSGTADKLEETASTLQWNLLLALVITYLLMAALFESFLYPFVIMFSVPLAALGGFLGLAAVNATIGYQALDVLTMLGFIILVGTVVNNAILIVHQTLNHIREEGMAPQQSIQQSVRNRIRPIFMSVSTSVFGMMPLILFPGAGSELYRGLGSVVVGGLIVSTVFTLFLVPALLSLTLDIRLALGRLIRSLRPSSEAPADAG
ncbi:MAG: efflux RND transporter permease subunit [Acidobacteriota bacterium]